MIEQLNDCVEKWQNICQKNDSISPRLYDEYGVNLGLRDEKGNGVLTGLKKVSQTVANGQVSFSCEGWNTTNARVFVWQEMNPVYKSCQLYNE